MSTHSILPSPAPMEAAYEGSPAKRRRTTPAATREIGLMRKSHQDNGSATFLGSSSGIYFIRIVYNAFARRSAHLNQAQHSPPKDNLVPGEDDQLQHQSPGQDAAPTLQNELWTPHELDHHRAAKFSFDHLVHWTRSYFDHWHPMFPYLLGADFLRILEQISAANGLSRLTTAETILVRSIVSISLMDRRQLNASRSRAGSRAGAASSTSKHASTGAVPPASLVFRTVDQAMQSLHTLFCDPPTIPILQAAFSVELFLASLLRLNAASRIGGVITRTAFQLGLHRCPARYACFTPDEAAVRRRLFWSIYCLERYLSQALGIPLSIRDDDVDVCYPGMETHATPGGASEGAPDDRLRLLTHLAKFARVRGLVVELRNKSISHNQDSSPTATQINGELTQWWNEVYDDVHLDPEDDDDDPHVSLAPLHRLILVVLRHESILSMNRPLLATESSAPEYRTALQVCIESSRSLIAALRKYLPSSNTVVPLVWPSFTWAVWMSCLILVYAAWEGEFSVAGASRYTKSGLAILQNLALRDNSWPQTCIEALRDLESALSNPAPTPNAPSSLLPQSQHQHQQNQTQTQNPQQNTQQTLHPDSAPNPNTTSSNGIPQLPAGLDTTGLGMSGEMAAPDPPPTANSHYHNPSVIFGDSSSINPSFFHGFAADGFFSGDSGVEGMMSDLWTVADGPWLIQENYDMNGSGGVL